MNGSFQVKLPLDRFNGSFRDISFPTVHRQHRFSLAAPDQEMPSLPRGERTALLFKPAFQFTAGHDLSLTSRIGDAQHMC
jgi:hypothetical protein